MRKFGRTWFPPPDFRCAVRVGGKMMSLESALRLRLTQTFYLVGKTMAPYIICDWQLWLWNEAKSALFDSFKLDAFHEEFIERYGGNDVPLDEKEFISWWYQQAGCEALPPRLANECIWLGIESSKQTVGCVSRGDLND